MKRELKISVNEFIESKSLSDQQLDDLLNLVDENPRRQHTRRIAVASITAAIIVLSVFWSTILREPADLSRQIAEEVIANHLKMEPLEVSSHSLLDLRMHFSELGFLIRKPDFSGNDSLKLLGGRYCSIQGVAAAQLRLQDGKTGQLETLYQAPYDKALSASLPHLQDGDDPIRHYIHGIAVDIWVTKGVLYARTYSEP